MADSYFLLVQRSAFSYLLQSPLSPERNKSCFLHSSRSTPVLVPGILTVTLGWSRRCSLCSFLSSQENRLLAAAILFVSNWPPRAPRFVTQWMPKMSFFRRNSSKQPSEASSEPSSPSPSPAPKRLPSSTSVSNSAPRSPNSSSTSVVSADESENGLANLPEAAQEPSEPTPWSFTTTTTWKTIEDVVEPKTIRGDAREVEIVRPTTDCGPYDASILICADSIGRPLELKIMLICGLSVFVTAWGGAPIASVLDRATHLRARGVGKNVLVLIAGTNDISQLVSSLPQKSAEPSSCQEAVKQIVDQYRFFLKHNYDRYDVVFFAELLPQKWEDEEKQALATMLIKSFNEELVNLVAEYDFEIATNDNKRDFQAFVIPVYEQFDFDDLDPLNNGKESSVHLKYVRPERTFRRSEAEIEAENRRRPRERFATVIGLFLEQTLETCVQFLPKIRNLVNDDTVFIRNNRVFVPASREIRAMERRFIMTSSLAWFQSWAPDGSLYNCSTFTFDEGSMSDPNAQEIRVAAALPEPAYLMRETFYDEQGTCAPDAKSQPSKVYWGGVWISVLARICLSINARCKVYEAIDHNDTSDYGDSAALRDVMQDKADIALTPLLITRSRFGSGNYSILASLKNKSYALILNKKYLTLDSSGTERIVVGSFTPESWMGIVACVLAMFTTLCLSQKLRELYYNKHFTWKETITDVFQGILIGDFPDEIWFIRETLPSTTTLTILSLVFSLIIINYMNAIIPYQLAVSAMLVPPFSTLPTFLSSPDFVAYGNKAVRESMLDSKNDVLRQFATRMSAVNNSQNYYEFMTRNSTDKFKEVYLAHKEGEILLANYSCDFVEAVPNVLSLTIAPFWFRRNSDIYYKFAPRYERLLSEKLVDSDLTYYRESSYDVLRRANKSKTLCIAKPLPHNPDLGNRGLTLVDLTLPFVGILIVSAAACLVLLAEIIVNRFSHRRIQPVMVDQSNSEISPTR